MVGAIAGNVIGLEITQWVNFLAGFGAIMLTFLAGAEIDPEVVKRKFWPSMSIGVMGFVAPYLGVLLYAHFVQGWIWPQAQIAGISLSTTSVAVVYAVMVETGFNKTELGKVILAACFINDLGTVLALGIVFAHFDAWLALFGAVTAAVLWLLPRFAPWFFCVQIEFCNTLVGKADPARTSSFCLSLTQGGQLVSPLSRVRTVIRSKPRPIPP